MTKRRQYMEPEKYAKEEKVWKERKIESIVRNNKCKEKDCHEWRQAGSSRCAKHAKIS